MVESGEAEVGVRSWSGEYMVVARHEPGDYFGEISVVTAWARTADVDAMTPMTLLRLIKDNYTCYHAHSLEVERRLSRSAASRATETLRLQSGHFSSPRKQTNSELEGA